MRDDRYRLGRYVLLLFSALLVGAAAAPRVVIIPGGTRSAPSPKPGGGRIFYRPHMSPDGAQAGPVFYEDGHRHLKQIGTLTRSMGIGWSPDGEHAFLQDNWGSNIADCYVLTPWAKGVAGRSLLKLIRQAAGHPTGAETPFRAHYYVHCDRWSSAEQVLGAVSGHTDTNPSHGFDHQFTYNVRTHHIAWRD